VPYVSAIFALLVAAAGWYYMFYSKAAHRLAEVEDQRLNQRRIRLRRVCGLAMFLLAICFFTLFWTFDLEQSRLAFALMMLAVMILLAAVLILAMIDVRLTYRLRQRRNDNHGNLRR
jgi:UDP-N-acetylmuramyl pentapeptide phosphotransferase/UDP-N-acetylglucosamine-1-phosphate transferase